MDQGVSNSNKKIWIFWDQEFAGTLWDKDEQHMIIELKYVEVGDTFHISVIYAKCKPALRIPLWETLKLKSTPCTVPWCVIGDFNVITSMGENIGGIPHQMKKSNDFISMIEKYGLIDLGFHGPRYTSFNGRGPGAIVWKRVDRGLVNDYWITSFPTTSITHLALVGSNHSPLLLKMHVRQDNAKKYFRFLNYWVKNGSFMPLVQEKPKEFEQKVKLAEEKWATTNDPTNRMILHEVQAQGRRRKLFIHKIKDEKGDWIQRDEAVREAACDYLFTEPGGHIREDLLNCIPTMTTNEDNGELSRDPEMEELKQVVFSMSPTSAAGLDGMNGKLFQ
ncbi:PREDICTED: uncharacterized protein LOC109238270 [Nicotiana attenuata]|uniref:uncharacterized protein LOC109238270 n=1 Tax=Nicotiana attenuata TaxID=49451 RepID=UPI0009054770|nr:PREDICTED: uncharacterized protein LOC109238270 [Nicotiana attenuata]